jgi:hypothetical protein
MQNRSLAVMARRTEAANTFDDFPTPPLATRALMEHVLTNLGPFKNLTCWEPACGAGDMSKVRKVSGRVLYEGFKGYCWSPC